jgi:hypothetical protein
LHTSGRSAASHVARVAGDEQCACLAADVVAHAEEDGVGVVELDRDVAVVLRREHLLQG